MVSFAAEFELDVRWLLGTGCWVVAATELSAVTRDARRKWIGSSG